MKSGLFITGTDTNAGKTWATLTLMHLLQQQNHCVVGMKPVASGCLWQQGEWRNEDALALQQASSIPLPYELINPYAYELPVSPDIAGSHNPVKLELLKQRYQTLQSLADVVLVEGAGGWLSPINATQSMSDLALALQLPVLLVVALRLGCINHASLTLAAIKQAGLRCLGWLAVSVDPDMVCPEQTLQVLKARLHAEFLGVLTYQAQADYQQLGQAVDLNVLSQQLSMTQ
ncbi:dethiobiotin synthase [Methylocucumis oryzae]|uniref:ATP-dependent dethiobiotin synthetase BioD n=1 Tax=Methylocucumis oryzae TaxID=1632867 RepID=A0A0F3IHS5_9GAMM|nr:dethiobiotin synthase [Methylocucumis oryzae]KJV06301.1 dethiobiotin synthetase [Methylocucumis oryzae]